MAGFPHLFRPIDIGRMTVKNRIFVPGHNTALSVAGLVGDEMIAYHEARAEAGVGMIAMEVSAVHPSYAPDGRLSVVTDDCIPGLGRMAAMGRRHDCRVLGQLFHPGRVAAASEDGSVMASHAPSEVADEFYKNVPMPLTTDRIRDIVDHYRLGAARMAEAGLDGIELVSSMGYLISQFLNPRLNLRTDEYGGTPENRLRFLREVITAVRRGAGDGIVVGIRISVDEMDGEGLRTDETIDIVRAVEADGKLDYVNVVGATTASYAGWLHVVPEMAMPNGYLAPLGARVKDAVALPVLIAGRVTRPRDAERIVASGQADMVGVVRGHIADPEFTRKAREGREDDIRVCIGCNQACIGHRLKGFPVSCIQHPETGRELACYRKPAADVAEEGHGGRRRPGRHEGGDRGGAARPRGDPLREGAAARGPGPAGPAAAGPLGVRRPRRQSRAGAGDSRGSRPHPHRGDGGACRRARGRTPSSWRPARCRGCPRSRGWKTPMSSTAGTCFSAGPIPASRWWSGTGAATGPAPVWPGCWRRTAAGCGSR